MVEMQTPNITSPKSETNRMRATSTVMPMAIGSPTASEMKRRRRRRSRLMSTSSSVMSAAAAGIPATDKHKISNNEALIHMVKATVGGGFLAMPEAFHNAGVVTGIVGTVVIGLSVLNMMSFIVRCSQTLRSGKYAAMIIADRNGRDSTGANGEADNDDDNNFEKFAQKYRNSKDLVLDPMDYPDTVAAVFKYGARGRFASWSSFARNFTSASLVTTYYGVNIIYVCIVAGTLKQLIDQYTSGAAEDAWYGLLHGLSIRWYPTLAGLLIIPVGMVRLMKYLVPFSIAANAFMLAGIGAVFYFIFIGDDQQIPLAPEDQAKLVVWPPTRWSLFAGSALCSLEGVGMLLHIENAMSRPLELAGPPFTLHQSMVVIMILNSVLGLCGYLKYGDLCEGSISLNLPRNNRLSEVIKTMIALGILLTYGLQLTVTADLAWQGLRKKIFNVPEGEPGATDDGDDEEWSAKMTAYYYAMRFALILGTIMVATAVPDIGPLVSLVGSVGFSVLGLIVPVAMETVWYYYPKENGGDEDHDDGDGDHDQRGSGRSNGSRAVTAVSATVECAVAAAVATTAEKRTPADRRRSFRRIVRYTKNVVILILALSALVGGAFYNVRDIVNQALRDSSDVKPAF
ncbi:proton-coupled amino acid transporter-like protein CG1139 [Sipha flava]|uniref:Proton-coupled amino acid transporter 4 n=1 Tax=Sipha flava TaxID=143950 RepID=A0A2S2Q088_9HEMI|nr:proton-coupled amino acid transporter-like protein CG1139 [Sipha flava]